jgi:predicted nuclease of predicted toxin-antitoxin system
LTPLGLLLDQGISPKVAVALCGSGFRAEHVHALGLATATDAEIVAAAQEKRFVVVTTDSDFSAIVARSRQRSPSVITLRLDNPTAEQQIAAVQALLRKLGMDELESCLIALEQHRYRRRPLPV